MRKECSIVRDLLPLTVEGLASEDTQAFVRAHLQTCPACRQAAEEAGSSADTPLPTPEAPLKSLRRTLRLKRLQTVFLTALSVLAVAVTFFSAVSAPQYFPYSPALLSVTAGGDGSVTVEFDRCVTGISCQAGAEPDSGTPVYFLQAWTSDWDTHFADRTPRQTLISAVDGQTPRVFYSQNNGQEDVLICGTNGTYDGVQSLPRLTPGYLLLMAAAGFVLLLLLRVFLRRRTTLCRWLDRLLPLPAAYGLGHLCVMGTSTVTYSMQRNFSLILLLTLLFWAITLAGLYLLRLRREINGKF